MKNRNPMSEVCPESKNSLKYYVCLFKNKNLILKPKSGVCQKSKIRYPKSETEVQSPKSEVCLKSDRSLSEVVYVKSEVCLKSAEDRILKFKIATKIQNG